jgi:glucosamine--fructose-6-phosphate aminotransferase (isomerizing)
MLKEGLFVLVFIGDGKTGVLNRNLVRDILEHGGTADLVSEEAVDPAFCLPLAPPRVRPILEILPVQIISLVLAARAKREPGRFTLASKVTTKE